MTDKPSIDQKTFSILRLSFIWRILFSIISIFTIASLWTGLISNNSLWQKILISVILVFAATGSIFAAFDIRSRRHRGRIISLGLDYLGFVVSFVMTLQVGHVFTGIDALGENFSRGVPFLGLALGGYLIGALGDKFNSKINIQESLKNISRWVIISGLILFLWQVDAVRGAIFFLTQLLSPVGLVSIVALIIFGFAIWALWREPSAKALNEKIHHEQFLSGWLFLSPNLLGFLIFFAGPLILSFYFAFTDSDAFNPPNWIGFANFAKIFNLKFAFLNSPDQLARDVINTQIFDEVGRLKLGNGGILFAAADKLFWIALRNTLTFTLFAVPLSVIPALLLSNILNSKLPGMKIFRAVYFMPSIAAIVGISLVWQWLYNATIGYINYFITIGINLWNTIFQAGVIDPKIQWTSDANTALLTVIIIAAWQSMGFNTVLFLAGLQNIPGELYEAATVDGAGPIQKFLRITLPMLAPSTFYVISVTTIQAMQVFEQVFILMNPPEGPNNSTITLVLYLYRSGFQNFKQGYASAIAWVLFIVIFGITLFQFKRQRSSSVYES